MKPHRCLILLLLASQCSWAQVSEDPQTSRPLQYPVFSRPLTHPSGLSKSSAAARRSFYKSKADWQRIIDSTWGPGLPLDQKLGLFDTYASALSNKFDGFLSLGLNWDSLRTHYRSRIDSSTSRGKFAAIMSRFARSLRDGHTSALDTIVVLTPPAPGVPTLILNGFSTAEHFGAVLTGLPDSTALVLRTVPNHPLGLQPGDVILGYEGVAWMKLVRELIDADLPILASGVGARSAETSALLRNVGNNWHLFDTIDIVKHSTKEIQHLSVLPLLTLPSTPMFASEQLDIPGISPAYSFWNGKTPDVSENRIQQVAYGTVPGTNCGYIQLVVEWPQTSADGELLKAVTALWNTQGLIIDLRWNGGGWALFDKAFGMLFSQSFSTLDDAYRAGPLSWSLGPASASAYYRIYGTAGSLYDRPIAVLLGPTCISMGDITAQRLRYHPMVQFFGRPTVSSMGDNVGLKGYTDWYLRHSISDMFHLSQPGVYLNRSEFPIDEPVWFNADDVANGKDPIVERALSWMTNLAYAHRVQLAQQCKDTLRITTRVNNPLAHDIKVTIFLREGSGIFRDSLSLKDDGLHGDGAIDDGVWGGFYAPSADATYLATVRTDDLTAGTSRTLPDAATCAFTRKALIVVDTRLTNFGRIDKGSLCCDSSFMVRNIGYGADTISITIDPGNVSLDSVLSVAPTMCILAPGDSQKVTFSIRPGPLPLASYFSSVHVESRTAFGQTVFEKFYYFEVVNTTSIPVVAALPTEFRLEQNYPNPFNPTTTIRCQLPKAGHASLKVYDVLGCEVAMLMNEIRQPGTYTVQWDAVGVPSGIYVYRLMAGEYYSAKKMMLLK